RLPAPWIRLTCALPSEEQVAPEPQGIERRVHAARPGRLDLLPPVRELQYPREAGSQLERTAHADELEVLVAEVVGAAPDGLALVANDLDPAVEHERELGLVFELQHAGVERV